MKKAMLSILNILLVIASYGQPSLPPSTPTWRLIVLGMTQDAGYPQAHCQKSCCEAFWQGRQSRKYATCLALLDTSTKQAWLFEATPDIRPQWHTLDSLGYELMGIFITHAHIGHYAGLMHLGREAVGTKNMPVYVMPRMKAFIESNGPWSQLVSLKNIQLMPMQNEMSITINDQATVRPFLVPHRDEYSETVGFKIAGLNRSVLFIPDIDKWESWEKDLAKEIKLVDYALVDASFFRNGELGDRDMSRIPHPFTTETMNLLKEQPDTEKSKVHFIHFNHTNPAMFESAEKDQVIQSGFSIVCEGMLLDL